MIQTSQIVQINIIKLNTQQKTTFAKPRDKITKGVCNKLQKVKYKSIILFFRACLVCNIRRDVVDDKVKAIRI